MHICMCMCVYHEYEQLYEVFSVSQTLDKFKYILVLLKNYKYVLGS